MADSKTTSSQKSIKIQEESNRSSILVQAKEKDDKSELLRTSITVEKSNNVKNLNDKDGIPMQTNLQRLIQNKLKRKKKIPQGTAAVDCQHNIGNKKRKTKTDSNIVNLTNNCSNNNSSDSNFTHQTVNSKNCAGNCSGSVSPIPTPVGVIPTTTMVVENEKRVVSKPPLPPKTDRVAQTIQTGVATGTPTKAPRLKRKLEEQNSMLVQKLNAHAEQLRLEISELKTALASEKSAVRSLRAQHEADARKAKVETKKLQNALDVTKKAATAVSVTISNQKKTKDEPSNFHIGDFGKMSHEISTLKEANRVLEDKIQMLNEAERRKTSDMRELKDSYEIRLTQIKKSAKTEINRLLEEIKTKERNIGQQRKEIHSFKNSTTNRKDVRIAQYPPEMRKLKDIERTGSSNNNSSNQKCIETTCGENEFHSMPHEITERILEAHDDSHDDLPIFRNKDPISSDSDSALSSAPPSISPQPPQTGSDCPDIWNSVKNYTKEITNLQNENESLLRENENVKKELQLAKQQILELEKAAIKLREKDNPRIQQQMERIQYLEHKEDNFVKEIHELREQNELLEFRILELEESHEKWSLRSNSTPDTRDMWTDTEKEADDILMYAADRSDSGVTSPHSHHHMDDRNMISPYDLSMLDHVSNDEIRRRITTMTKRPGIDEDDKLCLLQVLSLLNNLEASLSQDSVIASDEMMSIDLVKAKTSDYSSASSSPRSFLTDSQTSLQKSKSGGRIVATVLPYSSALSTPTDSPRKLRSWTATSLQESGVFEGDANESYSQYTQTELEDFPCQDGITTGDLCAEIEKLNKFREKIEECVTKSSTKSGVPVILSPNLSDQKRLQYYKDRLELLENKVLVYESSGDQQIKRLSERLQREIQLEALAKELRQRVENLQEDNLRLEEERCEFEEAENDTRLRLQRLEVDLEIFSQRNIELEMSKEASQAKLKEAKAQCATLKESIQKYESRLKTLENNEKNLNDSMNLIKNSMPAILLYNTLMVCGNQNATEPDTSNDHQKALVTQQCPCHSDCNTKVDCHHQLHELMSREKVLTQNIVDLNRAYNETLENADNLWAQLEKGYKDRLLDAKNTEQSMKSKITQLEQRLSCDSQCAQERIAQLEESEWAMKHRLCKLNKENKDMTAENEAVLAEYQSLKDKYGELKKFVEGPAQEALEREKQKVRILGEDLALANKMLADTELGHKGEITQLRSQLAKVNKELLHIEVTNAELKEEVYTLETQITELQRQRLIDEDKIRNLTDELRIKEEQLAALKPIAGPGMSLAQELGPVKRVSEDGVRDLTTASAKLAEAIANVEECRNCGTKGENIREMAKEVKVLADFVSSHKNVKKMKTSDEIINRLTNYFV